MELIEIDMVGAQSLQRGVKLRLRFCARAFLCFTSQENFLAMSLQRRPESQFILPIRGGDVKMIDAMFERVVHRLLSLCLTHLSQHRTAKAQHRTLLSGLAERPVSHLRL